MPVPVDDSVCRFIRKEDWSAILDKPKARSLKQRDMSVWHEDCLTQQGATLADLQIESLVGSGQLSLTVGEYLEIACRVSDCIGQPFRVQVEWRPDDQFVKEPWRQWRDAHVQVEVVGAFWKHFPPAFRDLLIITAQRKQAIIPPDLDPNES